MSNLAPAVGHAVKLIELLAGEREPMGVSEISRRLDLNKNMVFRILATLEQEGWIYCPQGSDSQYRLSLVPFQITSRVLNHMTLNTIALPYVHKLWQETGESTYLGILKEKEVLYIQHLDSIKSVKVAGIIGGSYPLHCTGPGKALLAFCESEFIEAYVAGKLKKYTTHTITDGEALKEHLGQVRHQGYAVDAEEYGNGIICLAAPVFDYTEKVIGTIGSSFSTINCSVEKMKAQYGKAIVDTAAEVSECLGYRRYKSSGS